MKMPDTPATRPCGPANCWSIAKNCGSWWENRRRRATPWCDPGCITGREKSKPRLVWPKANSPGTNEKPNAGAPPIAKHARLWPARERNSAAPAAGEKEHQMETKLVTGNLAELETECLIAIALDHGEKQENAAKLATKDPAIEKAAGELISSGEITGKAFETVLLHHPAGMKAKRLLVVGAGKAKTFGSAEVRKAARTAVRYLRSKMIKSCAFALPEVPSGADDAARVIVEGASVADFDPDTYCTDRKDFSMKEVAIAAQPAANDTKLQQAIDQARTIAESQNFTRELMNEPSNRLTPTILAERAREMCAKVGLKCEVMGPDKIKELKMGAFWSVSQGSDEEPRLIVMRYEPEGAPEKPVLGLVGKGITFDTGGISIKPADGMEKMKYDMAGVAAMIGAMRAIALLNPNLRAIGMVCATENLP